MKRLLAALVAVQIAAPLAAAGPVDPWSRLADVRSALTEASPVATDFVQSFTPSGFAVADEESGTLAMRLVDGDDLSECVRWDYLEPFPKGFLLCDRIAWAWNPGETTGRRQLLARADQFGLDLLRLSVDQLRRGYEASVEELEDGAVRIRLLPTSESTAAEIRDATLELDSVSRRLLSLAYHDVEGNLTRFTLGDYRPIDDAETVFSPPADLDWLDE